MKLTGAQVRFLTVTPWPTRQRLILIGTNNTLQLLETALVVEGRQKRLFLPVIDIFFQRLLSEWTTATIPYSRIVDFRSSGLWIWRILLTLLVWLPFLLRSPLSRAVPGGGDWLTNALLGMPALLLTYLLNAHVLATRSYLLFQQADGRLLLVAFRIRSRKRREEFEALLECNRRAAGKLPERARVSRPASGAVLGILVAYVTCQALGLPLWSLATTFLAQVFGTRLPGMAFNTFGPGVWSAGGGMLLLFLQPLLQFAYDQGPVLLLAFLLVRWNEMLRWFATGLLALHGLAPMGQFLLAGWSEGGTVQRFPRHPAPTFEMDILPAMATGLFYLLLALLLARQRFRGSGEEPTATA